MLDLLDKDFKSAIENMFRESNKTFTNNKMKNSKQYHTKQKTSIKKQKLFEKKNRNCGLEKHKSSNSAHLSWQGKKKVNLKIGQLHSLGNRQEKE